MSTPYSRVYWSIVEDDRFRGIYVDNHALATWLRLLLVADGTWPVPAPLPRRIHGPSLRKLVDKGIVELVPEDCYRIHGLDSERMRRSNAGRNAAASRWRNATGNAGALPVPMLDKPRRDEPRQEETSSSRDETSTAETRQDENRETPSTADWARLREKLADTAAEEPYESRIRNYWRKQGLPVDD